MYTAFLQKWYAVKLALKCHTSDLFLDSVDTILFAVHFPWTNTESNVMMMIKSDVCSSDQAHISCRNRLTDAGLRSSLELHPTGSMMDWQLIFLSYYDQNLRPLQIDMQSMPAGKVHRNKCVDYEWLYTKVRWQEQAGCWFERLLRWNGIWLHVFMSAYNITHKYCIPWSQGQNLLPEVLPIDPDARHSVRLQAIGFDSTAGTEFTGYAVRCLSARLHRGWSDM